MEHLLTFYEIFILDIKINKVTQVTQVFKIFYNKQLCFKIKNQFNYDNKSKHKNFNNKIASLTRKTKFILAPYNNGS